MMNLIHLSIEKLGEIDLEENGGKYKYQIWLGLENDASADLDYRSLCLCTTLEEAIEYVDSFKLVKTIEPKTANQYVELRKTK